MSRKYLLTIDEQQANALISALDFHMRVGGLGQFREVIDPWRFRCDDEAIEPATRALEEAQRLLTGFTRGASHGIHSPKVPDEHRMGYDLIQVIRHRLAWDRTPEGGFGVWFDEPHQTSKHPLATIEQKERKP